MNKYTFPFNTCEVLNKNGIAQLYSALFNIINSLIILNFLIKTKKKYTFILLFFILCFELFHSYSHIFHTSIHTTIQTNIIHLITYFINLALFNVFYCYTKKIPNYGFIFYIMALICFDIYSIFNLTLIYYIASQSAIFISLLLYYFQQLPIFIQKSVYKIIIVVCIIIILFINEQYNCDKMLKFYPQFPYHIFIEIFGIILFYIICSNFYKI
jgi:hypothetical protein